MMIEPSDQSAWHVLTDIFAGDPIAAPEPEAPANVLLVGIAGFSGESSESASSPLGVREIVEQVAEQHPGAQTAVMSWTDRQEVIDLVTAVHEASPNTDIVFVTHSLGVPTGLEAATVLDAAGVPVTGIYMIDGVGVGGDAVPSNVGWAVNLSSTSGEGIDGQAVIDGAVNVGVDGTSHTEIDGNAWVQDIIAEHIDVVLSLPGPGAFDPVPVEASSTEPDDGWSPGFSYGDVSDPSPSFDLGGPGASYEGPVGDFGGGSGDFGGGWADFGGSGTDVGGSIGGDSGTSSDSSGASSSGDSGGSSDSGGGWGDFGGSGTDVGGSIGGDSSTSGDSSGASSSGDSGGSSDSGGGGSD